jgi:rod shape-determining protein MreC
MYRKQVRRRRAVLVALVVACLMLISISISEAQSGPLHSIQNGLGSVFNPIQDGASRVLKPARDMVNWFDETFHARGENDKLKSQNAQLKQQVLDMEQAAEKAGYADQLDELIAASSLDGYKRVDATIIGRNFSVWYSTVKIDVGSSDGVSKNDSVITDDGLVGRVQSVFGGYAVVKLITDGENAVTADVVGGNAEGLVQPIVGSPGELDLGLIQGDEDKIQDGDKLVTAGFNSGDLKSLYPAGIPIGEVDETIPAEQEKRATVHIKPFADLADIDQVTVLTGSGA